MTKKELTEISRMIINYIINNSEIEAYFEFKDCAKKLFDEKKHLEIISLYEKIIKIASNKTLFYIFEVAYSYVSNKDEKNAEKIYEHLLIEDPQNTALLNNLSNIKKNNRKYKEAYDLISKAYQLNNDDEIISRNYDNLYEIITEQKEREQKFKHSLIFLPRENEFVLNKLKTFISNLKKENEFINGIIPIARWKFKVLIVTDEQKAESLREQWLEKNYITLTGDRGEHFEYVYELNPYIEKEIDNLKTKTIKSEWIKGFEALNLNTLEEINYFRNLKKINKVSREFKILLKRDYDELTFNFIVKNNKSTIILSGSLIETLLIYHLKKKKITKINYQVNGKEINRDLFEATLNDLLQFVEQNKELEKQFLHLGNISRIYRNYIHPGKELKGNEKLDDSKANLCYISASELINNIL